MGTKNGINMAARRDLTDEEYNEIEQYFLTKSQLRNRAMFAIQRFAGYRISEVLSLKIKDLFTPDGNMVGKVWVSPSNMKKNGDRMAIPVHDRMEEAVMQHVEQLREQDGFSRDWYIFQSRKGDNKPITNVQAIRILKKATNALNIYDRVGTHSMRKTFGMRVYENTGHDIRATQKAFGHKNVETTLHYIGADTEKINQAILAQ